MTEEVDPEEYRRLTTPVTELTFLEYLQKMNVWAFFTVPGTTFLFLFLILHDAPYPWWIALGLGVLLGLAWATLLVTWRLWREYVQEVRKDADFVRTITTGSHSFPEPLAWAMVHWMHEDKAHVAAFAALTYFRRRWPEEAAEFDALPDEEKERLRLEAMMKFEEREP